MQGKAYFWTGLGLCIVGIGLIVYRTDQLFVHLVGVGAVVVGAIIAVRNAQA